MINRSKKRVTKNSQEGGYSLGGERGLCLGGALESLSMANKVLIPNLGSSFTRWLHYNLFNRTLFYVLPIFLLYSQDIFKNTYQRG